MEPLSDQIAFANSEFSLAVIASDPDGDELSFSFSSELSGADQRATITQTQPGRALFSWTPLASDVGQYAFDFTASDGELNTTQSISINVTNSSGDFNAPFFVKPLGTGTTVDLEIQQCAEVPIVVEDHDSASVELGQQEPLIVGAQLEQSGELTGNWTFCPTKEQAASDDRFTLTLSADDGSATTLKEYLIVLRSGDGSDCPGDPPLVTHVAEDASTVVDVAITATVSDDLGMKYEPLLYFSTTAPSNPPDLSAMTQLTMTLLDGDDKSGTWGADIPNPVAAESAGSTAQLYYLIVAQDNDDTMGTCDHITQSPSTGVHQITVTNPGGSGGLGLCESCTADAQCGDAGDNCVVMGGAPHCFTACDSDSDCATDYYCSFSEFTSVDNASARQCIPNDYECDTTSSSGNCTDDAYEDNDSLAAATSKPELTTGTYDSLVSCPLPTSGDDEDWYRIEISSDSEITLSIAGGTSTDLDLALTDESGTVLDKSDSLSSNETVTICVTPGTYYVRVYAWDDAENSYSLTYSGSNTSCGGGTCQDDNNEPDDSLGEARDVSFSSGKFVSETQAICANDEDWFEVFMFDGETLYGSLTFLQSNAMEDLDLWLFDAQGNDLTGCSEATPLDCDPFNGQSGTSDETLEWDITSTGAYYVVVHGWNGSANLYDICIGLDAADCPP